MQKIVLGKTGLSVSRLSFGGLFVANFSTELAEAKKAVRAALDAGINYIDTAPGYGNSEEVLGHCLEGVREPVILSTKLGGRPQPFEPKNPAALRASVEESLRLLKRDTIDMLMIHEPDRPGQYAWWESFNPYTGPVLDVLAALKDEGKIRFTGLGGTTAYELARVMRSGLFDVVLTAFNYSLLWREAENDILPTAKKLGMGVVVGSPLQQGVFSRRFDAEIERARFLAPPRREQLRALYALADETGLAMPEMALRFVLSNPDIHTVLMGARSEVEAAGNIRAATAGPLPKDVLDRINAIAARVPFQPRDEPAGLGWLLGNPEGWNGPGNVA